MALIALRKDLPGPNIKSRKEIDGAMAEILKFLALNQPWTQGQGGVQALQGLDVGLLIQTENTTAPGRMQIEVENLSHLLLKQGIGTSQEVAHAMRFEHQLGQNALYCGRTHGQNLAASSDQPGQIAHAVVRKAPKLALLSPLAGDGDDGVAGQRGKNPAGDPTGANPAPRLSARPDRLRPRPQAAAAHTAQSACATFAPNSVTCRFGPQSPDWTRPRVPIGECSPAAPSVAAFCPPAAKLPTLAVRQHLTGSHSGARAYIPLDGKHCQEYTANELVKHGTRTDPTPSFAAGA